MDLEKNILVPCSDIFKSDISSGGPVFGELLGAFSRLHRSVLLKQVQSQNRSQRDFHSRPSVNQSIDGPAKHHNLQEAQPKPSLRDGLWKMDGNRNKHNGNRSKHDLHDECEPSLETIHGIEWLLRGIHELPAVFEHLVLPLECSDVTKAAGCLEDLRVQGTLRLQFQMTHLSRCAEVEALEPKGDD